MKTHCYLFSLTALALLFVASTLNGSSSTPDAALFKENSLTPPAWILNRTVYEINVRQYSKEGTFAAVERDLDRIQDLGIGVIWLMPIHPIGEINRKGSLGSYYSVKDYHAVNPEFGGADSFRSLIQAAHARDIKVIIDWVANHTSWDNQLTQSNPEFFAKNAEGDFTPPHGTDWTDVIQLDFENRELWQYMIDAMSYWIYNYNIDGFRCDYAVGAPTEFWNEASEQLRALDPDLFLLAEADKGELNLNAFHASYGWQSHHAFNAIAKGDAPASHLDDIVARQKVLLPKGTLLLNFTTNHDENSWNGTTKERLGPAKRVFDALVFTLPGIPLVYNGQEANLSKALDFFEKDPIDWSDLSESEFYKQLTHLKRSCPALDARFGKFSRIDTTDNEKVYAFERSNDASQLIVFANLSSEPLEFTAASRTLSGSYRELTSSEKTAFDQVARLNIEAWGFRIFEKTAIR